MVEKAPSCTAHSNPSISAAQQNQTVYRVLKHTLQFPVSGHLPRMPSTPPHCQHTHAYTHKPLFFVPSLPHLANACASHDIPRMTPPFKSYPWPQPLVRVSEFSLCAPTHPPRLPPPPLQVCAGTGAVGPGIRAQGMLGAEDQRVVQEAARWGKVTSKVSLKNPFSA